MQREYHIEQPNIIQALLLLAMYNPGGWWNWQASASSEVEYALSEQGMADALELTDSIVRGYSDAIPSSGSTVVSTAGAAIAMYKDKDGRLNVSIHIQPEILMLNSSAEIAQAINDLRDKGLEYLVRTVAK